MNILLSFVKGGGIWIFVALAALGWWRTEIKRAEARGEAAILVQQADSLRRAFGDSTQLWAGRDSASGAKLGALNTAVDSLTGVLGLSRTLARRERGRADSTIASMLRAFGDTSGAVIILGALDSLEAEADLCGLTLVACDSITVAQEAIILDVRGRLTQADQVIINQGTALERLEGLAGRGGLDLLHISEGLAIVLLTVLHFTR